MNSVADLMQGIGSAAKGAARTLALATTEQKNGALRAAASALRASSAQILAANDADTLESGAGLSAAMLDRLRLDESRVLGMARGLEEIAAARDPIGAVLAQWPRPNGLIIQRICVPLGVMGIIYESRPNVTADAGALCLKSGNAVVLRGSSSAVHSNAVLAQITAEAAVAAGLPAGCVSLIAGGGREELAELATQDGSVDLIIPRGGESLKAALQAVATVPVIYAASGNCHVYVDASADLDQAEAIVMNAKTQRPGVCNAAETLLVHEAVAADFLPRMLDALAAAGVLIRADRRTRAIVDSHAATAGAADRQAPDLIIEDATDEDWASEYLAPVLAVGVVDSVAEAIEHVGRYGSGHSEAILTCDTAAARAFQLGVDAACVYVNASTRFTDGGEFGMGAEIGNSTQKLHARGPIGLRELCTFKYLIEGDGHVRD